MRQSDARAQSLATLLVIVPVIAPLEAVLTAPFDRAHRFAEHEHEHDHEQSEDAPVIIAHSF